MTEIKETDDRLYEAWRNAGVMQRMDMLAYLSRIKSRNDEPSNNTEIK